MLKKFLNKKRKSTEQGMSLAEILVSVGLIVLLGAAITTTAITLSSSTSDFTKASVTQHEAQETISEMTRDISAATNITTAQDYRISLETQEDNTKYEVSYFYWNPDNSAEVSIPTGVITGDLPDFPAIMQWRKEKGASTGKLSVAAPGYSIFQQKRTLFTYYNQANATMITPVASTKLSEIKRVDFGFSLKVEDRPARIELASGATPRYTAAEPSTSGSQTASKVDGCVAPQLLPTTTITPRTKFATINWVPVVGANTYTIYRENDNQETNPMVVAVINDYNVTSYVDETVKWGETYRYYMVSGCTIGTSPNGDGMTFTVTPDQPAFVNINTKKDVTDIQKNTTEAGTTNPAKDKVYTVARGLTNQLSWTKMNGALGYIIYRSGVQIARVGPDTTSYQDYGRSFGDATPYTVVAFNVGSNGSGGASAASNPQTLISPPAKSTIIVAKPDTSTDSTNTNNVITIATRASNTTGYQVYKTSTSAASADCANVSRDKNLDFTTNSKTDVVEWGTHSCYVLIGYNDAGVGEFSDNIEAKQKPGKFSVYSLSSTSHQRIDTGAPLPGNAVCWTANVPDWVTCDGNYYRGQACCTPLAMFTNEGKTNITIAWNSSKNAYGDYIIYQDRTETSGVVDQGDDNITANRVYNNANQAIVFNNQMPGSLFAYNIDAYAANGEIRKVNGAPLAHVSKPDIPRYANINRQSKSGAPWYQRRVTIGIDGTPITIRGTTDNVIYEADTNGYTSATFGNWGRYTAYTNTFNGPMVGWINVYDRMTRLGVTNYSAGVGSQLEVTGNGCGPCYSYYADTPESYPNYWAGHSPVYYAGGYASGTTIEGGSTEAMPTPTPPGPPQEGLPDPLTEQCKNIYESDPKFRNEYGCEFGTGIPSPTAYSYLQHMDGTTARIWWNIVPFATGYEIRVDYLGGETQKTYVAGGQTNTKDVVLVDGVINTITIITKNSVNVSSPSEPFLVDMPGIPQNVTMNTFVGKTANVTWDAVENVNKYLVTMISGGENYSYEVTSPTIDITIADAAAGGTVWVQSVKEVGSEDGSPAISTKSEPIVIAASEAPNNFKLISLTDQTAKLGWDKSIGAVTYKITGTYTGPTSTVTQIPEITGITGTTYDLTSIPYARNVKLNVQAVNPNGISAKSNTVTFDVLPPKPTNVTLTSNDSLGKTTTTPSTVDWSEANCAVGTPQYKLSRILPTSSTIRDWQGTMSPSAYAPYVPTQATGGVITTYTSGNITYRAHRFNSNGNFQITQFGTDKTIDYLIVAGGGSGGSYVGGGGGGGGVIQNSTTSLVVGTSYPIVVGAGGTSVGSTTAQTSVQGNAGGNSSAFGITAIGGGGGGRYAQIAGSAGGSGGGSGGFQNETGLGGAGTSGQGNAGGNAIGPRPRGFTGGGGGGGAGGAGEASSNALNRGGNGGNGVISSILGTDYYFGGGGGGGNYADGARPGNGGLGGGGGGSSNTANTSGIGGTGGLNNGGNGSATGDPNNLGGNGGANTGGGGGGNGHFGLSGAGGTGIVVVRYKIADTSANMHLPGTSYQYRVEVRCVEGNFTSNVTTANHSFTAILTSTVSPSVAPTLNTPGTAISASGGTIQDYTRDGVTYRTHKFDSSGTFSVSSIGTTDGFIEYMVVGGGGGGGGVIGGGGGGGGVIESSTTVSATNYAITVGGGGLGGLGWNSYPQQGTAGQNSSAFGTTALGGGGGGAHGGADTRTTGMSGGSGGGGGGGAAGGAGTFGQGMAGATGDGNFGGGGGGAGSNGLRYTPGYYMQNGGQGKLIDLTASSTYFGGGGGGGSRASWSGSVGTGGAGGGGNGSTIDTSKAGGMDGANGYGGGGGGAGHNGGSGNRVGGNGGSGTVLIRYVLSTTEPYAGMAQKINVTSTGQCNDLHYGTTPVYNYYRNGVKFATTTATSAVSTDTSGVAGDVVTYDYTVQCQGTLNGVNYITPESPKSPARTVILKSNAISASGGAETTYTQNGITYKAHTFTANGTFTLNSTKLGGNRIEYLIVGGGGGGGANHAGGGGAGGLIWRTQDVPNNTYSVVVGNGGAGSTAHLTSRGGNGQNSSVFGVTALGGGGGGNRRDAGTAGIETGGSGGSGGGGGGQDSVHASGGGNATGQGNAGGWSSCCNNGAPKAGGGGGGAGGHGSWAYDYFGGTGGTGIQVNLDGTTRWYAAGGSGGGMGSSSGGSVNGIGGRGAWSGVAPTAGATNTGSGGGGGGGGGGAGAAGGSGIVIIRYVVP